ncbi:hypothetical protein DB347_01860 [Opitutaceae bacterium EW11]|nr:hypothetical protein DB347_01860 [Opitutaceae bacterium EW11]
MISHVNISPLAHRLLLAGLVPLIGFAPGCAATGTSTSPSSPPAATTQAPARYVCEAEFLTVEDVAALGLGPKFDQSFRDRMGIPPDRYASRGLGVAVVSGVAVWAAKGAVKWIAQQLQERAKEYTAEFGGAGVGREWSAQGGYAAISLKRWKLQGDAPAQLTHHAIFILPPVDPALGVYQLEPIYWSVTEPAPARTHGGEFTAVINLKLSALWNTSGEPRRLDATEFAWVLSGYKAGEPRLYAPPTKDPTAGLKTAPGSAPFGLPATKAVLYASFTVAEVDASNARKYLEQLSQAVGKQADAVGGLVEDKLK